MAEFQFLVGTLKTKLLSVAVTQRLLFQFLVGTLKTLPVINFIGLQDGFNSS